MTRNTVGFLLAPLLAPSAFFLLMAVRGLGNEGSSDASLFWMLVLGLIAAYLVAAILGLPLHLLLRRTGCQGYLAYMAGGAVIALVPFLPGLLSGKELTGYELLIMLSSIGLLGVLTGLLFWFIAIRTRERKTP